MANTKSTAVTKADEKPDYLREIESQNANLDQSDNFDSSDVVVPQIKLLQGLSAECESFDDAKAGRYWHTGFDVQLGDNVNFIVCSRRKKYLLLAPLEDGQGVLARSDDAKTWDRMGTWEVKLPQTKRTAKWKIDDQDVAKSGLDKWGTYDPEDEDSPPAATMVYEYLVILPDYPELGAAVLSISRSQIRKAKKGLNDKIQLHRSAGRPLQALVFNAKSVDEQSSSGSYKNFQFTQNGFASKKDYERAVELSQMLHSYQVADEGTAAQDQETTTGSADSDQF